MKTPRVALSDLTEAFSAISPSVLLTTPQKREGQNPNGTCPDKWPLGCNAQFRALEVCMALLNLITNELL